ncbi:Uncharacterized protein BP5553_04959 [Venustampulla echinocandica]|uniref:Uncharacterized protein n=1 Tax=Venustampulla echinocandica TaxID=2656787 RepID=A0A370TPT1_9HELO|nr:Uncharacterized protein BP5553_04959 [Venustampulla echinocandica]RDL37526.1 Uncharacterized protein BP5553_04959 [Venustampulla echinocandica]
MPARELASAFDAPNGVQRVSTTLLKKHKILPHPREERMTEVYPSTPAARSRDLVIDTGASISISKSDTSSPRTLKHTSRRIGDLPPTPPTHSRQSSGSHPAAATATATVTVTTPATANQYDIPATKNNPDIRSVPTTPPNQRSPPTPDVTPPRAMLLAIRPRAIDRYPSSRADSFKTARENPYSSDEDERSTARPVLPSAKPSAMAVTRLLEKRRRRKEIGLGLGLESDNEGATTPRAHADSPLEEFHVFDGEWASESNEVEREWDDNLMRNVTVRKRPGRVLDMFTDGAADEVVEDDIVSPTQATKVVRSLPLQERISRHRKQKEATEKASIEKRRERVPSVAGLESPDSFDIRRFSTMSGRSIASTVVEAMVVEAPPTRTRTLRHTKKQIGLRDVGSDQSTVSSAPNSVVSSEPHRLHHAAGRIPEQRHRSLASNTTVTTASSSGKSRRTVLKNGGIPVVVIPDRHSSTKSSKAPSLRSTSSRRTKRSMSLNSAPLSSSSKFNDPGYFDSLPRRNRTMSESAGSGDSVRTIDYPPNVPARRSSLSAPTSRNTSRAASLTTESLKAHNLLQPEIPKQPELVRLQSRLSAESHKDLGNHSPHLNVDHNGDPFFGKRLSAQVTPFSQFSYDTAGTTAEVSEAMAVSIYPHQNKSLLVVQQMASLDNSPRALGTAGSSQPTPPTMMLNDQATTVPVTPPQPTHPMDEIDSPLRNPRVPPAPPAIKFIPATPSGLTPGAEEEKQLGYDVDFDERPTTSDNKPTRGMSLMRRAFRNRRNSEPAILLGPGLLKRTFSLSNRRRELVDESTQTSRGGANPSTIYPSVADRPADGSRLHPFWRPSHFWDDLEDEGFADDELVGGYPKIDNRPAPPKRSLSGKLKRTFAILPIQDEYERPQYANERRTMRKSTSGNLRVVKQGSNSSFSSSDRRAYAVAKAQRKSAKGGQTIPGLGIRVEYGGWSGLKNKLRERRREQRNQKLRASISHPKAVQSGVDDVLRRRRSRSLSRSQI